MALSIRYQRVCWSEMVCAFYVLFIQVALYFLFRLVVTVKIPHIERLSIQNNEILFDRHYLLLTHIPKSDLIQPRLFKVMFKV